VSISASLPENSIRRLSKVMVRTIHLIGIAGLFGNAMMGISESIYITLAIISGVVLTLMEIYSGRIWFVQLRGVSLYLKLMLLLVIHYYPGSTIPCLIIIISISGFFSHAPSWIRYFSVIHKKVVLSQEDILG
jgi:hypothetical protein